MKLLLVALKYLKRYPLLTWSVLFSIIITSFFEGASFGILIPLIQSMTVYSSGFFEKIPIINHLGFSFSSLSQVKTMSLIFVLMFLIIAIKNAFLYLSNILIAKLRFGIIRDLRISLMNNLLEYDIKFFDNIKTGYILGNINMETERMGNFMLAVLQFFSLLARVIVYIAILFVISLKISIIIFLLIASVLLPIELIMKKVKKIGLQTSQSIANYNYKLIELISGIRLIKASGTEEMEGESFKTKINNIYHFSYQSNKYIHLIIPLSETFIFGLIVIFFLILVNLVKIDFANSFPFIAIYLLVLAKMLTQLNALNNQRSQAMSNLAAFTSYDKMYDKKDKMTIKSGDKEVSKFSDSIEFRVVKFSYINGKRILNDINLKIPRGKITAFVGTSGAGKSTLVNLILRFYDIESGEILIDGIDLRELDLRKWRKKIGFVSQDIFVFNTSVKENISYGYDGLSDEDIIKAAKAANAHDFIMELPDKYNTILGERGLRLSGGQRQRISIARAIIHNPEIFILDEATSSLDTETEKLINEAIDKLTKYRTVIAIAHRLSTILHADKIIVLDEGRVIESGKHMDLLAKNGLYKRLYEAQFRSQT